MTTKKIGSILALISIVLIAVGCVLFFRLNWHGEYVASQIQSSKSLPDGNYEITLTDELSEPPITLSMSPRQSIEASLLRNDLWRYVVINGGKKEGGQEFPIPPLKDIERLGWEAPDVYGTRVQYRLMPEKNGNVHNAKLVFTISTVK